MSDEYSLLSPFIQKYIYNHRWKELRDIQSRAIRVILQSDYHLLISSSTASGKTEAAFFPVLTILDKNPSSSIGVLYIGPLKALINDQFERLELLLQQSDIPLWHWHGDVSQSEKARALKNPSGVMQITPESLESLIMRHPEDIPRLFSDLKFVIIDEIHTFMGQERGSQLLCLLKRISDLAGCNPRRIGLSATISDYHDAKEWLKSGTDREVSLAKSTSAKDRNLQIHFSQVHIPDDQDADRILSDAELQFYQSIYQAVYGTNAIVFTNSRRCAEIVGRYLKQIAEAKNDDPGVFHVHHSSLSAALRKDAEIALKNKFSNAVAIATTTLELGIDIGDLEQVVQVGSPYSCSSYVQRLGRSGRRDNRSNMQFFCSESKSSTKSIMENMPWGLLKLIAIIELYDKNGWIEPFVMPKKPFSLVYQQTMSVLYASGGMKSGKLARTILSLPVFEHITENDYRVFLRYLLSINHLERTGDGLIHIGVTNEKIVSHYSFLAVFEEKQTYHVMLGTKEIGTVESISTLSPYLVLGGKSWKVLSVDQEKKIIEVETCENMGKIGVWHGAGVHIHTNIAKKMREILLADDVYPYLDESGKERLADARKLAVKYDMCNSLVCEADGTKYILPWIGTLELDTLFRELQYIVGSEVPLSFGVSGDFYLTVKTSMPTDLLKKKLYELRELPCDPYDLISPNEDPYNGKYAYFVPKELRIEEFAEDFIRQDFTYL